MKKVFFASMIALLALAGCTKDGNNTNSDTPQDPNGNTNQNENGNGNEKENGNENGNEQSDKTVSIIGSWIGVFESGNDTITFNEDNTFSVEGETYQEFGTYTNDDKTITTTLTKIMVREYQREDNGAPVQDGNGNYVYTDWQEQELSDDDKKPNTAEYKLAHQNDALLISTGADEGDGRSAAISPYIPYLKTTATTLDNLSELEGKWYWLSQFGENVMIRCVLIIRGDEAEYIITPWGERYTGKVTYEKGILTMANPAYTTTRWDDPDGDYEHMNEAQPEASEWRTPSGDPTDWYGAFVGGFRIPLVLAEDGQLYSIAANLPCNYTKQ